MSLFSVSPIRPPLRVALASLALALSAAPLAAQANAPADLKAAIKADYDAHLWPLFDWLHRNPELSHMEVQTAARAARELRAIPGLSVTEKVGGHGVVGVLKNGAGPTVMIRADMDGLPVEEKSGLANASTVRMKNHKGEMMPAMHACGHDMHVAAMIGAARRLAALRDRWSGTIVFIAQPAEEVTEGAPAMLRDGLYTRFPKPDYALALHVGSALATGQIAASESIQNSSADSVEIVIHGVGAHGAAPHMGKDPVYIGAQMVMALQGLISRSKSPLAAGVVTVGTFHSGTKENIISDKAMLGLTVRANDEATRKLLIDGIRTVAEGVGRANGLSGAMLPTVTVDEGTPVNLNDAPTVRRLNAMLDQAMPGARVPFVQRAMSGEDFAFFNQPELGVKSYYFSVGGSDPRWIEAARRAGQDLPGNHSPLFKIEPEGAIRTGVEAIVRAALDLLARTG